MNKVKFETGTMIKFALVASLLGNITLTTIIATNKREVNATSLLQPEVNLSSLPFAMKCDLDNAFGYIKDHIFGHICYNEWLHTSIIDLRFEKDGNVTLEDLNNSNLKIFC